jgi:hypothetical protein
VTVTAFLSSYIGGKEGTRLRREVKKLTVTSHQRLRNLNIYRGNLGWIFCGFGVDFCGFLWISVDLEWISVDLGPCELRDWTREIFIGTWTTIWTEAVKRIKLGLGQFMNGFLLFFPLRLSFRSVSVDFCGEFSG